MLRLDYISCFLTILSTLLIGRRKWQGWIVAGVNSIVITMIGIRTAQTGFIPANLFCIAIYAYNVLHWRGGSNQGSVVGQLTKIHRWRDERLPKGPRFASESLDADADSGSVFKLTHYQSSPGAAMSDTLAAQVAPAHIPRRWMRRRERVSAGDERVSRHSDRVRQRSLPHQR